MGFCQSKILAASPAHGGLRQGATTHEREKELGVLIDRISRSSPEEAHHDEAAMMATAGWGGARRELRQPLLAPSCRLGGRGAHLQGPGSNRSDNSTRSVPDADRRLQVELMQVDHSKRLTHIWRKQPSSCHIH